MKRFLKQGWDHPIRTRLWNDPVWSKVIAGFISSIILAVPSFLVLKACEEAKGATVEINSQNLLFVKYRSVQRDLNHRLGLLAYALTIINRSDDPLTVNDLQLKYSIGGRVDTLRATYVHTRPEGKPCAVVVDGKGKTICLVGWYNFIEVAHENKLLSKGQILRCSAFYLFPTTDATIVREIYKTMSMIVIDYNGNAQEVPFTCPPQNDQFKILYFPEKP
jgi:hypothetical protein